MTTPVPFHRIFGLNLVDFFRGTDVVVEVEKELSRKRQFLDVVVIRKGKHPIPRQLPDGFDELAPHNLITFKSYRESLDGWALTELLGHYVNYRKQVSRSRGKLLPESHFRMYAVCVRPPRKLIEAGLLQPVRPGVYDGVIPGVATIRVIVVRGLPLEEQNSLLHLFSGSARALRYARDHYHPQSTESNTLLYRLFKAYEEDPAMAVKLEEFVRESVEEMLSRLTPEERMKGLPPEELRKRLPKKERLVGLTPKERLEGLPPTKRLDGLSPDELRTIVADAQRRLAENGSSSESH